MYIIGLKLFFFLQSVDGLSPSNSHKLWCVYELPPSKLLRVLHGDEEVEMADHDAQQHPHPAAND